MGQQLAVWSIMHFQACNHLSRMAKRTNTVKNAEQRSSREWHFAIHADTQSSGRIGVAIADMFLKGLEDSVLNVGLRGRADQ